MPPIKRTKQIPFESIVVDDSFNCRQEYSGIEELATSIYNEGLLQFLGVRPMETGPDEPEKYYLIYGFRRYYALKHLREAHGNDYYAAIDVVINNGSLEDMRIRNLKENIDRKELSHYEIAQQVNRMVLAGFDQKQIAVRLGKNQSWVSYYYKAATKLSPIAQNALKNGDLSMDQAMYLADVPEEEQKAVVEQVLQAGNKAEQKQIVKNASNEAGKKRKYGTRGRPTAKNLITAVSAVSFEAQSDKYPEFEKFFYEGVAAGIRAALGDRDVDLNRLDPKKQYSDPNYHKRNDRLLAAGDEDPQKAAEAALDEAIRRANSDAPEDQDDDDEDGDSPDVKTFELPEIESSVVAESRVEPDEDAAPSQEDEYTYKARETIKGIDPDLQQPVKRKRGRPRKHPLPADKQG